MPKSRADAAHLIALLQAGFTTDDAAATADVTAFLAEMMSNGLISARE
ncbi:PqqD family peptide modification chaperone [Nocardia sp. CNY236]|nr:PqqD family peptide modification chaperone [Nocardia sp. CNY236]